MPLVAYRDVRFHQKSLAIIRQCNEIIAHYKETFGIVPTLRQLYYRMVGQNTIPNTERSYKNFGAIMSDARVSGKTDWLGIEDRTRSPQANSHWESPGHAMESIHAQYHEDLWRDQDCRPEIWIEKEALSSFAEKVSAKFDVLMLPCRGYVSMSELWSSSQRLIAIARGEMHHKGKPQRPIILHFGDHDPSGLDMTRDINDRLELFTGLGRLVYRVALNKNQIRKYRLPPNPAKVTDIRYEKYQQAHGSDSWELDALPPDVLVKMMEDAVQTLCVKSRMDRARKKMTRNRKRLEKAMLSLKD